MHCTGRSWWQAWGSVSICQGVPQPGVPTAGLQYVAGVIIAIHRCSRLQWASGLPTCPMLGSHSYQPHILSSPMSPEKKALLSIQAQSKMSLTPQFMKRRVSTIVMHSHHTVHRRHKTFVGWKTRGEKVWCSPKASKRFQTFKFPLKTNKNTAQKLWVLPVLSPSGEPSHKIIKIQTQEKAEMA